MVNYVILPEKLNKKISKYDIITKILMIKEHYSAVEGGNKLPNHVRLFIEHIEGLKEYTALLKTKKEITDQQKIEELYVAFINAYFNDENMQLLYKKIEKELKNTFRNN